MCVPEFSLVDSKMLKSVLLSPGKVDSDTHTSTVPPPSSTRNFDGIVALITVQSMQFKRSAENTIINYTIRA